MIAHLEFENEGSHYLSSSYTARFEKDLTIEGYLACYCDVCSVFWHKTKRNWPVHEAGPLFLASWH